MIGFNRLTTGQTLSCLLVLILLAPGPVAGKTRKGDRFYAAAKKAENAGDWEKAFEEYENALREDPAESNYQIGHRRTRFEASSTRR
jgi:hypothetical protein